jgi:integrase
MAAKTHPGITTRHRKPCRSREGGRCNCRPSYEAWVFSKRDGRKIRRTFSDLSEAKSWRSDAQGAVRKRTMRAPSKTTIEDAGKAWLTGARRGEIRNRSGDRYKPSAIRGYEQGLRLRVYPDLGGVRVAELRRSDLQAFVERLMAQGLDPSTIQVTLMPLRAIYRRAIARGEVEVNPTTGLELPAVRSKRDRIASPEEAAALIGALPTQDRAMWATAMYAGLRRGELMALGWEHIDLAKGVIRVERSWDDKEGFVDPKSRVGRRTVPIPSVLRSYLAEHRLRSHDLSGLAFGAGGRPMGATGVRKRSAAAWKEAELDRITLHEARHTFASLMIAAGVNAKALSTYMGHANIAITLDRYGHLMPGNEAEAAQLLDAYLDRGPDRLDAPRSAYSAP